MGVRVAKLVARWEADGGLAGFNERLWVMSWGTLPEPRE